MNALDFSVIGRALPFLMEGLLLNGLLTLLAAIGGLLFGTVLALLRLSPFAAVRIVAGGYVDFFRSMPLILVVFWFYFLVPVLVGRPVGGFASVLIAFTLFEAAYFCEIIRGGIQGLPQGQLLAAQSIGLKPIQAMRHVILPQAFRNMQPVLLTQVVILFQDTSLVYIVGLYDFVTVGSITASREGRLVEVYLFVAVVFFVICGIATYTVGRLSRGAAARRAQ